MPVFLVNPSDVSFGTAVITPRWLYVLAAATPSAYGDPIVVDETLEPLDLDAVGAGDVVGIGIHTSNAFRGYTLGRLAHERGACVVFGGIHATLFPDEAREHGAAHSVVRGDGDVVWAEALEDCAAGCPKPVYEGGRVSGQTFRAARWDLLPRASYMFGSVQTVRGCPKHCSFCSVWRTDGQQPRQRLAGAVVQEVLELRRLGFRFILLADDNFYPVTLEDLRLAGRRSDQSRLEELQAFARSDSTSWSSSPVCPMTSCSDADHHGSGRGPGVPGRRAQGAHPWCSCRRRIGDPGRTQGGLQGIHILGSFIFGLPTDKADTFHATADLAQRAGVSFAQFVMLMPFPGTLDFAKWEKEVGSGAQQIDGVPLTRYWLVPPGKRPKVYLPTRRCPTMKSVGAHSTPGTSSIRSA
jgi:hypothetical protein